MKNILLDALNIGSGIVGMLLFLWIIFPENRVKWELALTTFLALLFLFSVHRAKREK
jgi:hypothetical protein